MKKFKSFKIMRGFSAFLTALVLCMSMVVPAFALTPGEKGEIKVTGAEAGLKVSAYRLMDVKLDTNGNPQDPVYSWVPEVQAWINANYPAYKDANSFNKTAVDDGTAKEFYDKLAAAIKAGTISLDATDTQTTVGDGSATLSGTMGNYLILMENGMKIYSPSAVNLVPKWDAEKKEWVMTSPATVKLKSTEPTVEKEITKKEDGETDYQYNIGDPVPYKISADVPHYPDNKTIIPVFKISDALSEGLTFNDDLVVKAIVNGAEVTLAKDTDYTVSQPNGKTFEISFIYDKVANASKVIVEYSATVNEKAVVGEANPNKATLEYSNNPYFVPTEEEPDQPTKEKEDIEKVYTYGIKVTKVEKGTETGLMGAEFTLSKGGTKIKFVKKGDEYIVDSAGTEETLITDAKGKLNIKGLDVGDYLLTETKAPDGFSKLQNPITVTITDKKNGDKDGINGKVENKDGEDQAGGYVELNVENSKWVELPVTGGMGTVLFTAGGILLIGCAFVLLLIARKKKDMAA